VSLQWNSASAIYRLQEGLLYTILIDFVITMELVCLIKIYLIEICSKVRPGKHLFYAFPIQNGLK
jgi:hypothetical protein